MKTLTLYISDDMPGPTVEQKTYNVIAEGFDETGRGYCGAPGEPDHAANLDMAHKRYRITGARRMTEDHADGKTTIEGEWEVTIEGEDADIAEYEVVLKDLE